MKKFITVVAALAIAISASAQFGIIGGLTSSSAKIETALNDVNTNNINQYHAGITFKFDLPMGFAVQPALTYTVKGAKMDQFSLGELDLTTGFIEIPVQLQWGMSLPMVPLRPYAFAEPFVGYAVSNTLSETQGGKTVTNNSWDYVKNRLECGIGLGAGVDILKRIQVSVRYFWNFGNLYEVNELPIKGTAECNGIAASVAVFF